MKLTLLIALGILGSVFSTTTLAQGDAERGRALYATCGACHGMNGEGNRGLNSPALAGMEAWYTARQLRNFKSGARGSHADDVYGRQMAPMAQILPTDQAIDDVAVYIESMGN